MRVLVTGASGYCGQFVADALVKLGHHVFVTYRSAAAACEGLGPTATAIELDLTDAASCESCLTSACPDAIFNFAAVSSPMLCEKDPHASQAINCPAAFFAAVSRCSSRALFVQISTDQVRSDPRHLVLSKVVWSVQSAP
jgi:nucleoside-diphosphate-sugar epimerase